MAGRKKTTEKTETKKEYIVEYGPFIHKLRAKELLEKGDATLVRHDDRLWVQTGVMPKADAEAAVKALNSTRYSAKIVEVKH